MGFRAFSGLRKNSGKKAGSYDCTTLTINNSNVLNFIFQKRGVDTAQSFERDVTSNIRPGDLAPVGTSTSGVSRLSALAKSLFYLNAGNFYCLQNGTQNWIKLNMASLMKKTWVSNS